MNIANSTIYDWLPTLINTIHHWRAKRLTEPFLRGCKDAMEPLETRSVHIYGKLSSIFICISLAGKCTRSQRRRRHAREKGYLRFIGVCPVSHLTLFLLVFLNANVEYRPVVGMAALRNIDKVNDITVW